MALSTAQGFIGAGDVYIQPWLGSVLGKLVDVGNTTKYVIAPKSEIKRQISKKRETYGNPLSQLALQQPAEISMTIETVNRENLRYAFMGEDAAYTQAGGPIVAEATIAKLDGWVQLANEDLSAVVLKKGATVLTLGSTYELNARLGMYKILSTNAQTVAEDDDLTADYTAGAFTGAAIRGNVQPMIRAFMLLDGLNKVDDSIGVLRVWEAVLTPTSEFDWFSDEFNTIDLAGTLTVPTGRTEPFRFYAR